MVYVSAQESLIPWVGLGCALDRVDRVLRQQDDELGSVPPQQPASPDWEREAARDLQKSVLLGSARHWAHVPGPEAQGFAGAVALGSAEETSPSDGGGVKPWCET